MNVRDCIHLGRVFEGEDCPCPEKLRRCAVHGQCTGGTPREGVACCSSCGQREIEDMMPHEVNDQTTVGDMADVIERGPPGPWPSGWLGWGNTHDAHLKLLKQRLATLKDYPGGFAARGIVSCVSAKPGWSSGKELANGYLPGAWAMVKELRRMGCTLPVTFCHLGEDEWDPSLTRLVEPLGVTVIDLREHYRDDPWRILAGWESKVAAIIAAPYEEVLFLDADNLPLRDPTYLFDSKQYRGTGAVFWPDVPPHDREEWLPEGAWASVGLPYREGVDFESGQMLVDKSKCWRQLQVTRWINEHSDRYYAVVFGDKSTFHLGWAVLNSVWTMPMAGAGWNGGALIQHDLKGHPLFQHGCQNKPTLAGYPQPGAVDFLDECNAHLAELRSKWGGELWHNSDPTPGERAVIDRLEGQVFDYRQIGSGARAIRLVQDSRIGRGWAQLEHTWSYIGDRLSVRAVNGRVTMLLTEGSDGVWRGRWLDYERYEIHLVPEDKA